MNIAAQFNEVFGGTDHRQLAFNQRDKYIEKDQLEAYKSLIFEETDFDKDYEKQFGEKKKHRHHKEKTDGNGEKLHKHRHHHKSGEEKSKQTNIKDDTINKILVEKKI